VVTLGWICRLKNKAFMLLFSGEIPHVTFIRLRLNLVGSIKMDHIEEGCRNVKWTEWVKDDVI
jgi:hypothetical protein